MIAEQTFAAIALLDAGITPVFGETTGDASDPTPIHDEMLTEIVLDELSGVETDWLIRSRDSRGRFVSKSARADA